MGSRLNFHIVVCLYKIKIVYCDMNYLRKWILKHKNLYRLAINGRRFFVHILMILFSFYPIDSKKIVIINFFGKDYGDSGKSIAEHLLKKYPDFNLVWATLSGGRAAIPDKIKVVKYRSIRYYKEMATAIIWLDNARKSREIVKRKGQYYIQLWHGSVPLKKIEKDCEQSLSVDYILDAKHDSLMADLIVSGSKHFTNVIRNAFWYDGEILECGTPRCDIMFRITDELKENVRKQIGIDAETKIVLYAPTFRSDKSTEYYNIDFDKVLSKLYDLSGDEWVFALRLHPNMAEKSDFVDYSDKIYNVTLYPDLYELLSVADVVITDYSSVMFEAGILNIPVFLFATDVEEYVFDRNFYFDFYSLPFPVSQNNEELIDLIENYSADLYKSSLDKFFSDIGICETGKATELVVEHMLQFIDRV